MLTPIYGRLGSERAGEAMGSLSLVRAVGMGVLPWNIDGAKHENLIVPAIAARLNCVASCALSESHRKV